jgi:hypothetical protein
MIALLEASIFLRISVLILLFSEQNFFASVTLTDFQPLEKNYNWTITYFFGVTENSVVTTYEF